MINIIILIVVVCLNLNSFAIELPQESARTVPMPSAQEHPLLVGSKAFLRWCVDPRTFEVYAMAGAARNSPAKDFVMGINKRIADGVYKLCTIYSSELFLRNICIGYLRGSTGVHSSGELHSRFEAGLQGRLSAFLKTHTVMGEIKGGVAIRYSMLGPHAFLSFKKKFEHFEFRIDGVMDVQEAFSKGISSDKHYIALCLSPKMKKEYILPFIWVVLAREGASVMVGIKSDD